MAGIIVTGASGAFGAAVVQLLRRRGSSVVAIDISQPAADADFFLGGVDLAEPTAVQDAFRRATETIGPLAGLVNIAGGFCWELCADGSIESWDGMYRKNLRTAAISCQAATKHMRPGGSIVNVGAAGAASPAAGMAPYAASKAGVLALTQSLAEELQPRGIRVNAILPTIFDTAPNRQDMPDADRTQWVSVDKAAQVVAFLLSEDSFAITGSALRLAMA